MARKTIYLARERTCCDGLCFQRNPAQGGTCPLDRGTEADELPRSAEDDRFRAMVWRWFVAVVAAVAAAVYLAARGHA